MQRDGKPWDIYATSRQLDSHDIQLTDKMAENNFYFGRKWQMKNLHMSKKSSTFVADLEGERSSILKISNLQFYILAIRILFTSEKTCKGTKYFNTNQINYKNYDNSFKFFCKRQQIK